MKKLLEITLLFFLLAYNSYSQSNLLSGSLLLKVHEGVSFTFTDVIIGNDTNVHTGISAIDNLNDQYVCTQIEYLFSQTADYGLERWFHFKFNSSIDASTLIASYSQLTSYFEYVEGFEIPTVAYLPNDPLIDPVGCKAYFDMFLPEAWDVELGDPNVIIGVIDNACDWRHPDTDSILTITVKKQNLTINNHIYDCYGYINENLNPYFPFMYFEENIGLIRHKLVFVSGSGIDTTHYIVYDLQNKVLNN